MPIAEAHWAQPGQRTSMSRVTAAALSRSLIRAVSTCDASLRPFYGTNVQAVTYLHFGLL